MNPSCAHPHEYAPAPRATALVSHPNLALLPRSFPLHQPREIAAVKAQSRRRPIHFLAHQIALQLKANTLRAISMHIKTPWRIQGDHGVGSVARIADQNLLNPRSHNNSVQLLPVIREHARLGGNHAALAYGNHRLAVQRRREHNRAVLHGHWRNAVRHCGVVCHALTVQIL